MKTIVLLVSLLGGAAAVGGTVTGVFSGREASAQTSYYGDGSKKNVTSYVDSVKQGRSEQWYPNGTMEWSGEYADGFRAGEWSFWNEDGSPDAERSGRYEQGRKAAQ